MDDHFDSELVGQIKLELCNSMQKVVTGLKIQPSFIVIPPTLDKFIRKNKVYFNDFVVPLQHHMEYPEHLCGFFMGKPVYVSPAAEQILVF